MTKFKSNFNDIIFSIVFIKNTYFISKISSEKSILHLIFKNIEYS